MKERGILFTPQNYAKCAAGSKTQTRRIVQWPDWVSEDDKIALALQRPCTGLAYYYEGLPTRKFTSPYGYAGDRLYVKEGLEPTPLGNRVQYRRDHAVVRSSTLWHWQNNYLSPLHMPKWAARLWLYVTALRVERLQEISEEDARAEGVTIRPDAEIAARVAGDTAARMEYWALWESINGKGSWDLNPWVWVLEFRKVPA